MQLAASATNADLPNPSLEHFIAYSLYRACQPLEVTIAALILLRRLKSRFPAARGSSGHRLFITTFIISSKLLCDDVYSSRSWAVVAQNLFTLGQLSQMEREMCAYLEWDLGVEEAELGLFEARLRTEYRPPIVLNRAVATADIRPSRRRCGGRLIPLATTAKSTSCTSRLSSWTHEPAFM